MHEALGAVAEFLARYGALEDAKAITGVLAKMGHPVPEDSPLRWRALLSAIKLELDNSEGDVDYVFLFERVTQLFTIVPQEQRKTLFNSPLFLHLLVKRFAVAFDGLDAEVFKLESDELCHAEGVYELCLVLQDKMDPRQTGSELATFLATFAKIFEQHEPKDCWEAFYDKHRLNEASFRRDMKRALCVVEANTLGPTQIEVAFPSNGANASQKKRISKALLHNKFSDSGGSESLWKDLSTVNSVAEPRQARERPQRPEPAARTARPASAPAPAAESHIWSTRVPLDLTSETVKVDASESPLSEMSDAGPAYPRPASTRSRRDALPARAVPGRSRRSTPPAGGEATAEPPDSTDAPGALNTPTTRKKRKRWTKQEVDALRQGYKLYSKHPNVWMLIKTNFADELRARSNVDLKDKFRNLIKYGQLPHDE